MTTIDRFDGTEYAFLSNFWMAPITHDGIVYPSTEHAYQASKSPNLGQRKIISELSTPAEAKRAGRKCQEYRDWPAMKDSIMWQLLLLKFANHAPLQGRLAGTGSAMLIEGNDWGDTYWGVCDGIGTNRLGEMLMRVRELFK